jgi:hypothetical protein
MRTSRLLTSSMMVASLEQYEDSKNVNETTESGRTRMNGIWSNDVYEYIHIQSAVSPNNHDNPPVNMTTDRPTMIQTTRYRNV